LRENEITKLGHGVAQRRKQQVLGKSVVSEVGPARPGPM
jgi:hypothetical protein